MNKKYVWSFAGEVHEASSRAQMIDALKKIDGEYFCKINDGWESKGNLSTQEYKQLLRDSIFVPCPRGNDSVDSFRLYEALEVGSIPVVERDEYWNDLFGDDHPLIQVSDWSKAAKDIEILSDEPDWLNNYSNRLSSWWNEYKNDLKRKIRTTVFERQNSDIVKINPSVVQYNYIKYILYRTESYPQDCPAYYTASSGKKINFYRSIAGYQLTVGGAKTIDCTFDFGDYSYAKSKMVELAGTHKIKIEDVRFIENTIEENDGKISCLACCTILSDIDVFEGQRKDDGSWDEKKPIGLKLKTSPGLCRVNLNTGKIQYIKTLSSRTDDIQKNWLMFKRDDFYYCIYSMFPLIYRCAKSIDDIQFSDQEKAVHAKLHNATCPIQISENRYAMICHSERFAADGLPWAYKKYIVTFDVIDQKISNVFSKELDINKEYYCSSIIKEDDKIRVFAGVEDIDHISFLIDIPQDENLKTKQQQLIQLAKQWQNFVGYDFLKYICREMIKPEMPSEKFSVYNPGKKIAVVSLYTHEIADYAVCSEKSIREYCERQGYTFYVYRDKLDANGSANWSKARAILNHIDDHEDVVWMDSDTIIFNPEKRFEDVLARCTGTKKIVACEDVGTHNKKLPKGSMLNSGVLIFRNHFYTKNLIKKWMNFDGDKSSLYASGGDQEILCDILKKSDGFGFNRKIFPMNEFNTEPRFVDENTFIVHFMAYPKQLKTIFMNYWVSR